MGAGQRNRLFSLEAPAETSTGGHGTPNWPVQDYAWGSMEGVGGTAETLIDQAVYRVEMLLHPNIKPTWRLGLVGTNRKFRILNPPQDPTGRGRDMVLTVQENT